MCKIIFALLLHAAAAAPWTDCDQQADQKQGPFSTLQFTNTTWNKTIFYSVGPEPAANNADNKFPLVVFMHGSTGQWDFYADNLKHFASHGVIVVFPFIKSPEKDKKPLTTNTDGTYLIKAIEFAKAASVDPQNKLFYNKVDTSNIAIAGHSMGATCSIAASHTLVDDPSIKLTIAQHPGVCGPFGPPPLPATWMPADMAAVASAHPVLMTTATNDGAFWPAPQTAKHEHGCFDQVVPKVKGGKGMAFVEFTSDACAEDGARKPLVTDGGHDCPMKIPRGGWPENPWLLTAIKLYTQQGGSSESKCYDLLWGNSLTSLRNDNSTANTTEVHEPRS
jgi:dienelactone hydrolase